MRMHYDQAKVDVCVTNDSMSCYFLLESLLQSTNEREVALVTCV